MIGGGEEGKGEGLGAIGQAGCANTGGQGLCFARPAGDKGAPGAEAGRSVAAARCSPGKMRLAVRTLLACAVLGECGRGEGPQRRRPRRPLQPGPHHTCPWAPRWGWKHPSLSLALPHCTPAPALALPQGPADPAFASADFSFSSCFLLPVD